MIEAFDIRFWVRGVGLAVLWMFLAHPAFPCEPIEEEAAQEQPPERPTNATRGLNTVYAPRVWADAQPDLSPQVNLAKVIQMIAQDCEQEAPGKTPMADSAFLRHAGLLPPQSDLVRRAFVAAEIARSTETVVAILLPLAQQASDPVVRYRAYTSMALRILRSPGAMTVKDAQGFVEEAAGLAAHLPNLDDGTIASADVDFLQARLCQISGGQPRTCKLHLDVALKKDRFFVAARQLRIEMNDRILTSNGDRLTGSYCSQTLQQILFDADKK